MKRITLIFIIISFIAASVSFAEDKISIKPLVGTWVNTDYHKINKDGKWVVKPYITLDVFDEGDRTERNKA